MEGRKRSRIFVWATYAVVLASVVGVRTPAIADTMSKQEFEARVRDYLLANPEIVMQAVQNLEARQREAEQREAEIALLSQAEEIFRDPDSPVGGNPTGDVTVVEFFDYNCTYCRQVAPVMTQAEATDPQLRVVYKEFPILGSGSLYAARAALAAHRQGRYEDFHKALMKTKGQVGEALVLKVSAGLGLDVARLTADMRDPTIQAAIDRNLELAQSLLINGTPGFVVGDQILRGATDLSTMQQVIEQARKDKK
jgi:protein-disulfide isomerase